MRGEIKEMGGFLRDLFCGYLFKEYFGIFNKKCEKEDWNGLIKFLVYPFVFIFSLWLTLALLLVGTPIILLVRFLLPLERFFKKVGKGIVWLDKKLRF